MGCMQNSYQEVHSHVQDLQTDEGNVQYISYLCINWLLHHLALSTDPLLETLIQIFKLFSDKKDKLRAFLTKRESNIILL